MDEPAKHRSSMGAGNGEQGTGAPHLMILVMKLRG